MRVLHVIGHLRGGGAQVLLQGLLPAIASRGVESHLCALTKGPIVVDPPTATTVHRLDRRRFDPRILLELRRLVRDVRPDLLHLHLEQAVVLGLLVARWAKIPAIVHEHGGIMTMRWYRMCVRRLLPRAARVIAVSHAVARCLQREHAFDSTSIDVVHNGIPLKRQRISRTRLRACLGFGDDDLIMLFAGRLRRNKGVDVLLDAMPTITSTNERVSLLIAGDGPLRPHLDREVTNANLSSQVRFLGWWQDMPSLLGAADLLVVPSRIEPLGIVVLEAFSAGLAVVASNVGGLPEMLENEVTGLLVEPSDSEALAAACLRLLADPQLRRSLTDGGARVLSDRFTLERMADRLLSVYDSLYEGAVASPTSEQRLHQDAGEIDRD